MVDLLALVAGAAVGVLVGVAVLGIRRGSAPRPAPAPRRAPAAPTAPPAPVPAAAGAGHAIRVNRPASAPAAVPTAPVAAAVPTAPMAAAGPSPVAGRLEVEGAQAPVALGDEPVTIGRGADQVLRVHDERASRAHAVVRRRAKGGWELADAGSANGTQLNDHRIPDGRVAPLRDGDRIGVGGTTITYREGGGDPDPTDRRPPADPDATRIA
ncbi:MAG TPA: FHA domain-containing protein [Acidimicrobiales bacterium]|nr:FHA domain-containing protein [Acidimicrobiales bacterium]